MKEPGNAAVWWLGAVQCVTWGVLYYGFPVWQLPLQQQAGASPTWVAAAYSAALLVAAVLAPRVGRGFDRGHGAALLRLGLLAAVGGLVMLAAARSGWALMLGWLCVGLAMSLTLYESAFALVQRAIAEPLPRLRALAAVTVMGGLASTLCLPLMGWLVTSLGLRGALLSGAVLVLVAGWVIESRVLRGLPAAVAGEGTTRASAVAGPTAGTGGPIRGLAAVFTSGTVAGMALVTLLVPLMVSRGTGLAGAAAVLGSLGLSQLPGRLWLLRGGRLPSVGVLTVWPLGMQAAGLLMVAVSPTVGVAAIGVALFGLGAGLHTLARPWLVQERFGAEAGYRNGQVAQWQGFGRALAPVASVGAATMVGTPWVLAVLATVLVLVMPAAWRIATGDQEPPGAAPRRRRRSSITAVTSAPVKNTSAA